ncbi:MAG: hypothetical protein QNJ14_09895 [Woeseiaceae bacterium]|nr:hypothetical protein [Woeseiaceae bacterium]
MRISSKRAKTAVVTWLVAYPIITFLLVTLEPVFVGWPMPLRALLLSAIMVPVMVFWALPAATALFKEFLSQ